MDDRQKDRLKTRQPPAAAFTYARAVIQDAANDAARLDPGASTKAVLKRWDAAVDDWAIGDKEHTIHDPEDATEGRNFALPGEVVEVRWNPRSKRFECVGSFGLYRKAVVYETDGIDQDATGEVTIWVNEAETDPIQRVTAANNWLELGTVAESAECYVRWFPDEEQWVIVASEGGGGPYIGKLDSTLSEGSSANVTRWIRNDAGTAWEATSPAITDLVYDWLLSTGESASSGRKIIYDKHTQSGLFIALGIQCEA